MIRVMSDTIKRIAVDRNETLSNQIYTNLFWLIEEMQELQCAIEKDDTTEIIMELLDVITIIRVVDKEILYTLLKELIYVPNIDIQQFKKVSERWIEKKVEKYKGNTKTIFGKEILYKDSVIIALDNFIIKI